MGYSVGHYEGDTLVVETTLITANIGPTGIWEGLHSDTSRPFAKPESGRIAVKVINHLGDEVMKVFSVEA